MANCGECEDSLCYHDGTNFRGDVCVSVNFRTGGQVGGVSSFFVYVCEYECISWGSRIISAVLVGKRARGGGQLFYQKKGDQFAYIGVKVHEPTCLDQKVALLH